MKALSSFGSLFLAQLTLPSMLLKIIFLHFSPMTPLGPSQCPSHTQAQGLAQLGCVALSSPEVGTAQALFFKEGLLIPIYSS